MYKHIFIINPEAGKKKALDLSDYIYENFEEALIVETEYPGHASEIAKEYAGPNNILYSVGGDGTLNEVINGVMESEYSEVTTVADVPCGSGNDFIKCFTNIKDPVTLLEHYKRLRMKTVDVGVINGRSFVNISSVGFDAEIVLGAKKFKRLPLISAEFAYIISVFATLIKLKDYKIKLSIDGEKPRDISVLFVTMANGNYYGGGMKAAPNAIINDGLFNFCLVDKITRREVPFLLPKFIKGKHEHLKPVHIIQGKKLIITSDQPLPINMDGEIALSDHVQVEIIPNALKFLVP